MIQLRQASKLRRRRDAIELRAGNRATEAAAEVNRADCWKQVSADADTRWRPTPWPRRERGKRGKFEMG